MFPVLPACFLQFHNGAGFSIWLSMFAVPARAYFLLQSLVCSVGEYTEWCLSQCLAVGIFGVAGVEAKEDIDMTMKIRPDKSTNPS